MEKELATAKGLFEEEILSQEEYDESVAEIEAKFAKKGKKAPASVFLNLPAIASL